MHKSDFLLFLTCLCCPWMCPVLCSRGRETPSAPLGLVPLRGGTVLASAWQTKRPLWLPHGEQKVRYVLTPTKFRLPR